MLDTFAREISARWGLGDQGRPLVQMLVAHISNPATGGLPGFLEQFRKSGWNGMVNSWVDNDTSAQAPSTAQVEAVLGREDGFLNQATAYLGLSYDKVIAAVAGVLPQLVGRMTPDGTVPAVLPAEFGAFAREGQALLGAGIASGASSTAYGTARSPLHQAPAAAAPAAPASSGGLTRWLPWLMAALAVILGLSYCNKAKDTGGATAPEAVSIAPAPQVSPAPAAVVPAPVAPGASAMPAPSQAPVVKGSAVDSFTAPDGAGVVDEMHNGMPVLRVFFDTGKTEVPAVFAGKAQPVADFLKANPDAKAVISGFNDPTGDPVRNAQLSKERAQAVKAALESAGVAADRAVLEKPAQTSDTGTTNAASRRVDVVLHR